jgi:mevalonate kinase
MGEHAAVYGHPAMVAAIDRRLEVALTEADEPPGAGGVGTAGAGTVELVLPQIDVHASVPWSEIHRETRACRLAWEAYRTNPAPERFADLASKDPARVVRLALGEASRAIGAETGGPTCRLTVRSDIPVGAGFGSSAAVAVAVVFAYLARLGLQDDDARIARAALEVERRQHGMPSGVDSMAVQRGGLLWAVKDKDGQVAVETVHPRAKAVMHALFLYDTGTPAETTGSVVAAVRARRDAHPETFDRTLQAMADATREWRRALESTAPSPASIVALIRRFEAGLEDLDVVPESVRRAIRAIEEHGGAAKISGAGTLSGRGAGSLLVYDPCRARESAARQLASYLPVEVQLGAQGVRREPVPGEA